MAIQRASQTVVIGRCGGEERLAIVESEGPPGEGTRKFANKLIHDEFGGGPSAWAAALAWVTRSSRRFRLEVAVATPFSLFIVAAIYWGEHATLVPDRSAEFPAPPASKTAVPALPPRAGPLLVVGLRPYAGYEYLPDDPSAPSSLPSPPRKAHPQLK